MPTPPVSPQEIQRRLDAYKKALSEGHLPLGVMPKRGQLGAIKVAAERLRVSGPALYQAVRVGLQSAEPEITLPTFPDDDISATQILDHMAKRFERGKAASDAKRWFRIKLASNDPIALNWFGDPHLGSNGCNVPLLRRDVEIVASTPGMYGANIGDTVDGWGGRLIRLYADNDVSKKTERKLARWFLQDSGVKWLLWLHGNHDSMGGDLTHYMEALNTALVPMIDWRAQFILVFPNGVEVRVDAAHNHKGHSMWNELHGQERAAYMEEPADLIVAGHHHTWAVKAKELPDGRVVNLVRARGYKFMDAHATRWQFAEQQQGASIVTIFNPVSESVTGRVQVFSDVRDGAKYLNYLRANTGGPDNGTPPKRKKS
jgi:calcineurin-like phosphoesterase family protein